MSLPFDAVVTCTIYVCVIGMDLNMSSELANSAFLMNLVTVNLDSIVEID